MAAAEIILIFKSNSITFLRALIYSGCFHHTEISFPPSHCVMEIFVLWMNVRLSGRSSHSAAGGLPCAGGCGTRGRSGGARSGRCGKPGPRVQACGCTDPQAPAPGAGSDAGSDSAKLISEIDVQVLCIDFFLFSTTRSLHWFKQSHTFWRW